jgi:hypothetical protein
LLVDSGRPAALCPECGASIPVRALTAEAESERLRGAGRFIRTTAAVAGAALGIVLLNLDLAGFGLALLRTGTTANTADAADQSSKSNDPESTSSWNSRSSAARAYTSSKWSTRAKSLSRS